MKYKGLIIAIFACWAQAAFSMGLGEAVTHSWLGEPLVADIAIRDTEGWQAHQLKVSLSGEPAAWVRDIQATIVNMNGGWAIRLRSHLPVHEPAMALKLELRWPEGRLQRD
jgi:pilus assembly protein FimV